MTCEGCRGAEVDGRQIHMHDCPLVAAERFRRKDLARYERRRRRHERFDPRWRWNLTTSDVFGCAVLMVVAIVVLLYFGGVIG